MVGAVKLYETFVARPFHRRSSLNVNIFDHLITKYDRMLLNMRHILMY